MINEFENFSGNKVLQFFLFNPHKGVHINGLARELGIGAGTVKHYCDALLKENILICQAQGNQRIFSLNTNYFLVNELKKTFALVWLVDKNITKIASDKVNSFAIYGSFASGGFDEKSDLDLIIIGEKGDVDLSFVTKFSKDIKREVQVTIYSWVEWRKMEKLKEPFVNAVQKRNILIKGNNL